MWSRNPTPVSRAARAGAVERQRELDVGLRGRRSICGGAAHVSVDCRRTRASSIPRAPQSPRRGRSERPRAASFGGAGADRAPRHAPAKVARRERRGKARSAASRQHVVGARDVVAERGRALGADEHASGRAHAQPTSASTSAPISCRCSGAKAFASAIASRRSVAPGRSRTPPRRRSGVPGPSLEQLGERVADAAVGRDRHHEASRPVLGLGEHVQRRAGAARARRCPRRARPAGRSDPAKPSMPTLAESWCLASCT